jgi:hypothetical protein
LENIADSLQENTKLIELIIEHGDFPDGMKLLAATLKNKNLIHLTIFKCKLIDRDFQVIGQFLDLKKFTLFSVKLSLNSDVTPVAMHFFAMN